jgi:site-specific recombinase XerC
VGIREERPVPILTDFIEQHFEPWARARFEKSSPKTWRDYYRVGTLAIKNYKPLTSAKLNEITSETVADFAAHRQSAGLQVSTVNSSLQVLRRILRLAIEWGAVKSAPIVKMLPGERHRERVVTPQEQAKYLAATLEPLGSVAEVLVDTGLRPEGCFRLRWESIT